MRLTNQRRTVSIFVWISTEHAYSQLCRIECGGALCCLSYAGRPSVESTRRFSRLGRNLKKSTRCSGFSGVPVLLETLSPRSLWMEPTQLWRISGVSVHICSYVHPCLDRICHSRNLTIQSNMRGYWLSVITLNLWALFFQSRTNRKIRVFLYREQPPSVNLPLVCSVYLYVCSPRVYRVGFMKNTLYRT